MTGFATQACVTISVVKLEGAVLILLFCLALAIGWLFPKTSLGKLLHGVLIAAPARALSRLTPATAIFGVLAIIGITAFIQFARTDGLMILAQGIPEGIAWFVTFDVATYVDVIALVWLVAATVRLRMVWRALRASGAKLRQGLLRAASAGAAHGRPVAASRQQRNHRTATPFSSNDDEDGRGWGFVSLQIAA